MKKRYLVLEDNDPSGYKSGKAKKAKAEARIEALQFPRYSPDLNPMDYFLWEDIARRMRATEPAGAESMAAYKARLRTTALRTPTSVIQTALLNMKKRAHAVYQAKGGNISID